MNTLADAPQALENPLVWRNRFARLGPQWATPWRPQPLPAPYWVGRNDALAREIGLDPAWLASPAALEALSGNLLLAGSEPLASVYSGHQFGVWAGQLGDGRALLLGGIDGPDGRHWELQLKGAGRTPYSRMGDGRAVLRSSIREYLCSEAMHGLGIPTTRALCVTGSDAPVVRETVETAAVVTRVAASFVRFGHFEHHAALNQVEPLRALADHVIDHHFPELSGLPDRDARLLADVARRTADLVAQWQAVGFCHGVMNTDNMSILGLTIDYGPFGFMDGFDPNHICNHSDSQGRYAWARQPNIAYWNLFCLGQALLPLIGEPDAALAALETYRDRFPAALDERLNAKLGLGPVRDGDRAQAEALLQLLAAEHTDWTIFWRRFCAFDPGGENAALRDLFVDRAAFDAWAHGFAAHLQATGRRPDAAIARRSNPAYVLRNHLAEQAIRRAQEKDFSEVERLRTLLSSPYEEQPGCEADADFPPDWASTLEVSCSS